MKLQDIRVGMRVHDQYGNKYEVEAVRLDHVFFPVTLRCLEFAKAVRASRDMQLQYAGQAITIIPSIKTVVEWEDAQGVLLHFMDEAPQYPLQFTVQVQGEVKVLTYYPFSYAQHFEVTVENLQLTLGRTYEA